MSSLSMRWIAPDSHSAQAFPTEQTWQCCWYARGTGDLHCEDGYRRGLCMSSAVALVPTRIGRIQMMHFSFTMIILSVFSFMVKLLINTGKKKTIQTSGHSEELKLSNALFKLNLHCLHCILAVPDDDFCSSDQMQQSFLPFLLQPCFLPGQTCQKVCEESLTSLHSLTYLEL